MTKRLTVVMLAVVVILSGTGLGTAMAQDAPQAPGREQYVTQQFGDMLVDVAANGPLSASGYVASASLPWPGGVLPIVFEAGMTQAEANYVFYACNTIWRGVANVSCVNRTTQASYVFVTKSASGCFAYLGSPKPGAPAQRQLNLGVGCWDQRRVVHELGHSLGLMHEHQRPNRDNFVQIHLENVKPGQEGQFQLFAQGAGDFYTNAYDFGSVMHYEATAFTKNGLATIVPLPQYAAAAQGMGTAQAPSSYDGAVLRAVYGASAPQAPAAPALTITKASNPVQMRWTPNSSGGAPTSYTLVVGLQPGGSDWVIPMGAQTVLDANAPLGVPLYLRIMATNAAGSAWSNEVRLVTGAAALTMNAPIVQGRTVTLSWSGAANVILNVRAVQNGPIVAQVPLAGTSLVVPGVGPGTYYLTVSTGQQPESNMVVLVVR